MGEHADMSTPAASTRARGKSNLSSLVVDVPSPYEYDDEAVAVYRGDSLDFYHLWDTPTAIVSDGGYGVLGFEGDTSDHLGLPDWYEQHIQAWSRFAKPNTSLWFWNSEIGWAAVHPVLEKYGWRYVECCIWNKGRGHVAGNVNTATIRRFPVVTEVCALYVMEPRINGLTLRAWLLAEWKRTGLPQRKANDACGVKDAATRKYLTQGHLWYFPPPEKFDLLAGYANEHGDVNGRPYFSMDGDSPMTGSDWDNMRAKFRCPYGWTNVWERPPLNGAERIKAPNGKAAHLNQKPLDLVQAIIDASTDKGDVVWEPFGGLFTAVAAAAMSGRRAFGGEIDSDYYAMGVERLRQQETDLRLFDAQ